MSVKWRGSRHNNSFHRGRSPPPRRDALEADLFHCCKTGNLHQIKRLVEKRDVGVNIQNDWGNCPLYLACLHGHAEVVEYLLQKGAQYSAPSVESKRCFLGSLTQKVKDILDKYEFSLTVEKEEFKISDFQDFLLGLYERVPAYDTQLAVGTEVFLAHRFLLGSRSRYFKMIFEYGNPDDGILEMNDPMLTPEVFQYILRYMYTGQLLVPGNMIHVVAKQAAQLGLEYLQEFLNSKDWGPCTDEYITITHTLLNQRLAENLEQLAEGAVPPTFKNGHRRSSREEVTQLYPDVTFIVEEQAFQCHKVMLHGRSEYFRILLVKNEEEVHPSDDNYQQSMALPDVSAQAFVQVLAFVYTDTCHLTDDNCLELLLLAEKMALPGLKKMALDRVSESIKINSVVPIYKGALQLGLDQLCDECVEFMAEHFEELKGKGKFVTLLKREPKELTENLHDAIRKPALEGRRGECYEVLVENTNKKLKHLKHLLAGQHITFDPEYIEMPDGSSHTGKHGKFFSRHHNNNDSRTSNTSSMTHSSSGGSFHRMVRHLSENESCVVQ